MSRILFVVPPLVGHINPTVAIGAELTARGHDVAWAGQAATLRPLLPAGARVFPVVGDDFEERLRGGREPRRPPLGPEALKFVWESFIFPLAQAMLPGVADAITRFSPHVVVADQQAIAGAAAARRAGIPWVTAATTPGELLRPVAAMPATEAWVRGQMTAFQQANGITNPADLRFSGQLVLIFTTAALIGDTSTFEGHYVFTGPVLAPRPGPSTFPWNWLDPSRQHLLITLGTLTGPDAPHFYRTAITALAGLGRELQAILTTPPGDQAPPHILLAGHVPQLALLPHMSAVVCHGGLNTVCETLAHGLPLVITPVRDDQPIIAQQVAATGAGIRLRYNGLDATQLRSAIQTVLSNPSYRTAAAKVRDSFTAAGGAATAADHLERLL